MRSGRRSVRADRILFGDVRRLLAYAQRTADGRIALGAGVRYFYGSGIRDYFSPGPHFATTRGAFEFFPMSAMSRSPIVGVVCWGFREIRSRSSASTRDPGWARLVATRAVAWRRPNLAGRTLADPSRVATPADHVSMGRAPLARMGARAAALIGANVAPPNGRRSGPRREPRPPRPMARSALRSRIGALTPMRELATGAARSAPKSGGKVPGLTRSAEWVAQQGSAPDTAQRAPHRGRLQIWHRERT